MRNTRANEEADRHRCQELCRARCCRYITVQISSPRRKADYDELSWFLTHDNISVYVNNRRWHLEVSNPCKHLTKRSLCAIYETRPIVCRDHAADGCEYPDRPTFDLHFRSKEDFDAWWDAKRGRTRRKRGKTTKPSGRAGSG